MGERYSIDLFFEIDRLEAALVATAAMAKQVDEPSLVLLPSGREVILPFKAHESLSVPPHPHSGRWTIRPNEFAPVFDAVLDFEIDAEIDKYLEICNIPAEQRTIGLSTELYLNCGNRFVELSFAALESLASIFIVGQSRSVHRRFQTLLDQAGGVAGVIDVESDDFCLLLDDPERRILLDRQAFLDDDFDFDRGGPDYDVDGFAASLLAKLESSRG